MPAGHLFCPILKALLIVFRDRLFIRTCNSMWVQVPGIMHNWPDPIFGPLLIIKYGIPGIQTETVRPVLLMYCCTIDSEGSMKENKRYLRQLITFLVLILSTLFLYRILIKKCG